MSILPPKTIESHNLSIAWGEALLHAHDSNRANLSPLVVSIGGFTGDMPEEVPALRSAIDEALSREGKNESRISALTIVPYEMWERRKRPSIGDFSEFCTKRVAPRMKKLDARNQKGIYFERMMSFAGAKNGALATTNQLEFVIGLLNKRSTRWPRHSALQMSCFDPPKDHTGQPVRGFPCLQQVGISHDYKDSIAVNALYPSQYIFDRAYGNYLGLCQLGRIIAHETGLRFTRLNCIVGRPELGNVNKSSISALVAAAKSAIANCN